MSEDGLGERGAGERLRTRKPLLFSVPGEGWIGRRKMKLQNDGPRGGTEENLN